MKIWRNLRESITAPVLSFDEIWDTFPPNFVQTIIDSISGFVGQVRAKFLPKEDMYTLLELQG